MQEHTPVLVKEVLYFLDVLPGKQYIDATLGGGGHAEAILQNGGEVLGIDVDPGSLQTAEEYLAKACPGRYQTVPAPQGVFKAAQGNFSDLAKIASGQSFKKVDGILFDLGFASFQIDDPSRGLSFAHEGPLDMRLDPSLGVTAADIVNSLGEKQIYGLLKELAQEKRARAIARAIVRRRSLKGSFKTTKELKEVIENVYGDWSGGAIHPATRTFLALRIAVNLEFENLEKGLRQAHNLLRKKGRLVVISFHSGEDRIVKDFFKNSEKEGNLKILTKRPVVPSDQEIEENPRSRSAKLRAAEKL